MCELSSGSRELKDKLESLLESLFFIRAELFIFRTRVSWLEPERELLEILPLFWFWFVLLLF
jgi:hypothetical protein